MNATRSRGLAGRDRWVIGALAVGSVICATPGVHLAEVWLAHEPAVLLSHGLAVLGLGVTGWQWRARRARRAAPDAPAV